MGASPHGCSEKLVSEFMSPTCLGWCVEGETEGKPRFFDRRFDKERPARVYNDPAWWCCRCGKEDEFDRFAHLYGPRLRRFVIRRAHNHFPSYMVPDLCDEVSADTMTAIWQGWDRFDTPERAMYRIAERRLQRVAKQKADSLSVVPFEADDEMFEVEQLLAVGAVDELEDVIEQLALDQAIEKLPQPQRDYVIGRRRGEEYEHIAALHGRTKGTVHIGVRRGADRLRNALLAVAQVSNILDRLLPDPWGRVAQGAVVALVVVLSVLLLVSGNDSPEEDG